MIQEDEAARLYIALGRLARMVRTAGPDALGPGSVSALATLEREGAMRLGDLAAREGVRPPTLTRIIAALEADGFVTRQPDPADGRASLVAATPEGALVVRGFSSARVGLMLERLTALDEDQQRAVQDAIPVLEQLSR